ncbi:hypothetical protein WH367_22945 [Comamonas sp. MYb21]|uniref:hypothetical protein n=1 Tax=Comamonas sp. MYb21 TaxID=1848648 RepID=UPI0030962AEE
MSTSLLVQALAKLGELATSLGAAITNIAGVQGTANAIRTDVTNARDNVNATTNAARDNVKAHVSAAVGGINAVAIKSVQNIAVTAAFNLGNGGLGSSGWCDVTISPVNPAKAFVIQGRATYGGSNYQAVYRLISANVVRVEAFMGNPGSGQNVFFVVVESN